MSSTNEQAIEGKKLTAGCLFTQLPLKHSYFVWNKLEKGEGKTGMLTASLSRLRQGFSSSAPVLVKTCIPKLFYQTNPVVGGGLQSALAKCSL